VFRLLGLTGAKPKLNFVFAVFSEEGIDRRCDHDEHVLKRVGLRFEDFLYCSNRIVYQVNIRVTRVELQEIP